MDLEKLFKKYCRQAQFSEKYVQGLNVINNKIDALFRDPNAAKTESFIEFFIEQWKRAEDRIWRELFEKYFAKSDRILTDRFAYMAFASSLYNNDLGVVTLNSPSLWGKLSCHYRKQQIPYPFPSKEKSRPLRSRYDSEKYPFKSSQIAEVLKINSNWVIELAKRYCQQDKEYVVVEAGAKKWFWLNREAIEKIKANCPKSQRQKRVQTKNKALPIHGVARIYARMPTKGKWQAIAVCKGGKQVPIGSFQPTSRKAIAAAWALVKISEVEQAA